MRSAMNRRRIVFSWSRPSTYAYACIVEAQRALPDFEVALVAIPNENSRRLSALYPTVSTNWVEDNKLATWQDLGGVPDLFFQAGWSSAAFGALGAECVGAHRPVCLTFDTNAADLTRLVSRSVWMRTVGRHRFQAAFCAGRDGLRVARSFGFPARYTWSGVLGADPGIFHANESDDLHKREKRFVFVGNFTQRKRCAALLEAFQALPESYSSWGLRYVGSGPEEPMLQGHRSVTVRGRCSSEEVADELRQAPVLVLPSSAEPWGVVVHEAALTGCFLVLSDAVGAQYDLASPINAIVVPSGSSQSLTAGLITAADQIRDAPAQVQSMSELLAGAFGPVTFARSVRQIADSLVSKNGLC